MGMGPDGSASSLESMSTVTSPVRPKAVDWYRLGKKILQKRRTSMGCRVSSCLLRWCKCGWVRDIRGSSTVDELGEANPESTDPWSPAEESWEEVSVRESSAMMKTGC